MGPRATGRGRLSLPKRLRRRSRQSRRCGLLGYRNTGSAACACGMPALARRSRASNCSTRAAGRHARPRRRRSRWARRRRRAMRPTLSMARSRTLRRYLVLGTALGTSTTALSMARSSRRLRALRRYPPRSHAHAVGSQSAVPCTMGTRARALWWTRRTRPCTTPPIAVSGATSRRTAAQLGLACARSPSARGVTTRAEWPCRCTASTACAMQAARRGCGATGTSASFKRRSTANLVCGAQSSQL